MASTSTSTARPMTGGAAAPTGTVTCLFTDIEGSTRLEIDLGTGPYRDIRERHRALLRAAFSTHGGHEQSTEGDSFFVIFGAAHDAVAAAADAQRAVATEPWPDDAIVRVRMGLNTGEITSTGSDVIGLAINRAARVAGVAHGGQVVLSDSTRALVADHLPDGVSLRDLGQHRLKDLKAPERLSQLVIDGLASDFPPLRSVDLRPNNLPTQLTTFVGRDQELADATDLLGRTRLLTFTGPGGTGKTRLSIQVAGAVADSFPDGIWFVALEAVRDPELVAQTIARTIGLADAPNRPAIDSLVDAIGERTMLLVLDNFEQVVSAGPVVAELLRRCPNVTCLVTTRIALHVSGEQEYPVPGLPAPPDTSQMSEVDRLNLPRALREFDIETLGQFEAVRLFIARATAVKPNFAVTNANAPAVAGIAGRLHGMPLAIELAAARIKLLSPDQILARLDHHLAVLTAGARDLPERQQTLRGAIAWSYELLDAGSRLLLDRLSVFRGGFDLAAAERIADPEAEIDGDLVERIGELVDQSLIRVDDTRDEPRFSMLETIREFAAEMLDGRDETDLIGRRHAETFLAFAQDAAPHLSGADQRDWLDRIEREHDNLRAAIEWAAEHDPALASRLAYATWRFWQKRGYLHEARARMESMAARGWDLEPVDRARFAEAFGGIAYWQSDQPAAQRWYDEALAIWRTQGDAAELANALYNRAYAEMIAVMRGVGDPAAMAEGRLLLEEGLAIYRELGDTAGEANLLWGLGSYSYFTADAATAESWFRQSLELFRASGERTMEAWSLHMLSLAESGQARWEDALANGCHALRHFYAAGDISGVILVLDDLSIVALAMGDRQRAGRLWASARHLQETTGTMLADFVAGNAHLFDIPTPSDVIEADELATYQREGLAMGFDELVAYALDVDPADLDEVHPEPDVP